MISVLYVDDEPGLLELGRIFLEADGGFTVATSTSAGKALELLSTRSYGAIISDYQMPEIDGIAFLKEVRERFDDIPFILFTGRGREEVVIDAINNGADFYITKGGDPRPQFAELAHKIRQVVRRREAAGISDRKKMEDALRESEEKFRGMAERSSDLIFILNRQMSPTYVSPSARSIIGYDPDELVGKPPEFAASTIFSQAGPAIMDAVGSTMKGLPVDNVELQLTRKDGSPVYASLHAVPVLRAGGVLEGAQVTMRDVTDRRLAEAALRESEEKFRSFVENANEIVFSLDREGIFSYVSPKWTDMLGHDTGEVIGRPAAAFIHPDDYARNRTVFIQAVTEGKKTSGLEYRIQHKNGTWAWHSQSISPVYDAGGRIVAVQGICHDVSERRKAEDALRQANKKLNLLSGITRHDINNQLMALNGFVSLLQHHITDVSYNCYFSRITEASRNITEMIEFTKEYEKIGTGALIWQDLTSVINTAGKGVIPGKILVKNDLDATTEVFSDPMLEKVFFNLLDNSVRHGQQVTEIRVSSHPSGDDLVVVWEDNGVGIAADEKELIFERGFGKNTGLGMFLVREILSLTGITIAEAGEPGVGARFEITIPHGSWRITR